MKLEVPKLKNSGAFNSSDLEELPANDDLSSLEEAYSLGFRYRVSTAILKTLAFIAIVTGILLPFMPGILYLSTSTGLIVTGAILYLIATISDDIDKLTTNFQRQLNGNKRYQRLVLKRLESIKKA